MVLIFTAVWPEREATPSGKVKSLLYSLEQDGVVAKKKVADLLVDVLAEAGVRRIYGVSGDSLNGITDSIRKREQIQQRGVTKPDKPIDPSILLHRHPTSDLRINPVKRCHYRPIELLTGT